jgi:hypothetical protein
MKLYHSPKDSYTGTYTHTYIDFYTDREICKIKVIHYTKKYYTHTMQGTKNNLIRNCIIVIDRKKPMAAVTIRKRLNFFVTD